MSRSVWLSVALSISFGFFCIAAVSGQQETGAGNEPVMVYIQKIEFSGNTVIDTETLQKVVAHYRDTELTLEEMGELADLITVTYQEKGYILARAYLPEQEIENGVLKIAIAEGRVGKIRVSGKTVYHDRVVKRYFKHQDKHGVVNEELLEKGLLLSRETPDIQTEVVLKGGEDPGTVDVVLETQDSAKATFTAHLGLDYNNFGTEFTGKDRYGMTLDIIDHNWGAALNLRGVIGRNANDSALGIADLIVPVNSYGSKVAAGYLDGDYVIGQDLAALGLEGRTTIYGARIMHPLFKQKNRELRLTLGYDHKYIKNYLDDEVTGTDDIDQLYATVSYESLDRFLGKNFITLSGFFGKLDDLGQNGDQYNRSDPDMDFSRYRLSLTRIQKVFGYTNLLVRASGQYSPDRLTPVEMLVIGGYGTVRGHEPASEIGDSGYFATAELMFAPPFIAEKILFNQRIAQLAQFSIFFDTGGVKANDPVEPEGEFDSLFMSGYGVGFRLFYKDKFTFKYDIGFPVDPKTDTDDWYNYFMVKWNAF